MFNIRISAHCLMPTHYHILVQTPEMNLARCMRHLNGVFTQRYNVRHKSDGTLFRGRYKSILVEQDNILGATFHPELTDDGRIHRLFLDKVEAKTG